MKSIDLVRLRQLLVERFDEEELRTLCFELGIDYDSLRGEGKAGKARELIAYCQRHDRTPELLEKIKILRSHVRWDDEDLLVSGGEHKEPNMKSGFQNTDNKTKIAVALIGAGAIIIAALIGLMGGGGSNDTKPTPTGAMFTYQVQVRDQNTGEPIRGANVAIAVGGEIAPIDDVTDSNGYAILPIDASRVGKLGRISVQAPEYEEHIQTITLSENVLPDVIQLIPAP